MQLWHQDEATRRGESTPLTPGRRLAYTPEALFVPLAPGRCALLATGAVTVNGLPVPALRMLDDRDAILVAGASAVFTAADRAAAVPLPAEAAGVVCPRCRSAIRAGERSVSCPACRAWHHETNEMPCWSYDAACGACGEPTADPAWRPEP